MFGPLGLLTIYFIRNNRISPRVDCGREGCCISYYLSIKPSLLFLCSIFPNKESLLQTMTNSIYFQAFSICVQTDMNHGNSYKCYNVCSTHPENRTELFQFLFCISDYFPFSITRKINVKITWIEHITAWCRKFDDTLFLNDLQVCLC